MSKNKQSTAAADQKPETPSPVALTLDSILAEVSDKPLRDELFQSFHILNPLDYAKLLHARQVADSLKNRLLGLKVSQPPQYKGPDIGPLIEKTFEQLWAKLAEEARRSA